MSKQELLPEGWFAQNDIYQYRIMLDKLPKNSIIAEIGCWKGRSITCIHDIIKKNNIQVIAVDTFKGSKNDVDTLEEASKFDIYRIFLDNIRKFGIEKNIAVIKEDSILASKNIPDNFLDFLFLDADHSYDSVKNDLISWYPKIKKYGIISGHDYVPGNGVQEAVDEFFKNKELKFAQSIWIYDKGENQ